MVGAYPDKTLDKWRCSDCDSLWSRRENAEGCCAQEGENPKQKFGEAKYEMSYVPAQVLALLSVGMKEGAIKYGDHNYRDTKIKASTYYNANMRHWQAFWEGEDIDPDSGLPHPLKAACCSLIMVDAIMNGNWEDDRPTPPKNDWVGKVNEHLAKMREKLGKLKEVGCE